MRYRTLCILWAVVVVVGEVHGHRLDFGGQYSLWWFVCAVVGGLVVAVGGWFIDYKKIRRI